MRKNVEIFFTPSPTEGKEKQIGDSMIKMKSLIITVMIQAIVFSTCHSAYGEKPLFDFGDTLVLKIKGTYMFKEEKRSIYKISNSEYNVFDSGDMSPLQFKISIKSKYLVWKLVADDYKNELLYLQLPVKNGNTWNRFVDGRKYTYSVLETNHEEQSEVGKLPGCFKIKKSWIASNDEDTPGLLQETVYTIDYNLFVIKEELYIHKWLWHTDSIVDILKKIK